MSRAAYERLVEQDVAWLLRQPRTLEREHLVQIARRSVEAEYPRPSNGSPMVPLCPTCKASVAVVPSDDKPHPDAVAEHHDCLFPERGARWTLPAVCACVGDGCTGPDDERHVCVPGNACGVAGCATCGGVESTAAEILAAMPEPLRRLAADPETRARFNGMRVEVLSPPGATVTESVIHLSPEMARQLETRGTIPSPRQPAERDGREQVEDVIRTAVAEHAAKGGRTMTRYYLDTEFYENGSTIDLISIGIVCEDGREYYAVSAEARLDLVDDWIRVHVLPSLPPREDPAWKSRAQIASDIAAFATGKPEFWAYYADYDWVALCQLFGCMLGLPRHFPKFCLDLKQLSVSLGSPKHPKQESGGHNALEDARWNKRLHEFLREYVASNAASLSDAVIAALRDAGDHLVSPWVVRPPNAHGPAIAQRYEVSASIARLVDGENNRPLSSAMNRADEALRDDGHVLPEDVIRAAVEPWERRHAEEVRGLRAEVDRLARERDDLARKLAAERDDAGGAL